MRSAARPPGCYDKIPSNVRQNCFSCARWSRFRRPLRSPLPTPARLRKEQTRRIFFAQRASNLLLEQLLKHVLLLEQLLKLVLLFEQLLKPGLLLLKTASCRSTTQAPTLPSTNPCNKKIKNNHHIQIITTRRPFLQRITQCNPQPVSMCCCCCSSVFFIVALVNACYGAPLGHKNGGTQLSGNAHKFFREVDVHRSKGASVLPLEAAPKLAASSLRTCRPHKTWKSPPDLIQEHLFTKNTRKTEYLHVISDSAIGGTSFEETR